jgi:hypothetical protein
MSVREFRSPDGRQWRVWAVQPRGVLRERRQRGERRTTPVDMLEDPPVLERRRSPDRRAAGGRARPRPADLLPDGWREGWLVYEEVSPHVPEGNGEMRRLAPIPPQWESWSEAELARQLASATVSRRPR